MFDHTLADAVCFAIALLNFTPDAVQRLVLDTTIWRGILNCTRQWGKSTVMAIKALHHALIVAPGTTILVLCPTKHQAGEFFEALRTFMLQLGIRPCADGHNKPSVRLPNGSRIIGLSARSRLRGYRNVSLLLVDEAAEVSEAAYQVIRPALATSGEFGGKIWMMSTPQGTEGMFWRVWTHGGDDWTRFTVNADDCPRIYGQEYMCQFIDPPDCLLNREDIWRSIRNVPGIWHKERRSNLH